MANRTIREAFWQDVLREHLKTWKTMLVIRDTDILEETNVQESIDACKKIIKHVIKKHKQNFPNAKIMNENEQ